MYPNKWLRSSGDPPDVLLVNGDDLIDVFETLSDACSPGVSPDPYNRWRRARSRMSNTSEDLPDPETPVTANNKPNGKRTVISCRLWWRAPWMVMTRPAVCDEAAEPGWKPARTGNLR